LFAGIGGMDLGFERAGLVCKWQVEIDGYAQKVLAKHWPEVRRHDDVRTWPQADTERVDIIAGGFPCQDISYAGRGAGLDGERSGLFFEAVRVVCELRPRCVVLENVAALLTRGLDRVLGTLAEVGFDAEWHCIPAAAVGAPHIRDRTFILAYSANAYVSKVCKANSGLRTQWAKREFRGADGMFTGDGRWAPEPSVVRVVDGIPARVDRLRGLGNAVVPQVAEYIARHIKERIVND
jgi:DNA (cytosine-5)-methyltransferase 1